MLLLTSGGTPLTFLIEVIAGQWCANRACEALSAALSEPLRYLRYIFNTQIMFVQLNFMNFLQIVYSCFLRLSELCHFPYMFVCFVQSDLSVYVQPGAG